MSPLRVNIKRADTFRVAHSSKVYIIANITILYNRLSKN